MLSTASVGGFGGGPKSARGVEYGLACLPVSPISFLYRWKVEYEAPLTAAQATASVAPVAKMYLSTAWQIRMVLCFIIS